MNTMTTGAVELLKRVRIKSVVIQLLMRRVALGTYGRGIVTRQPSRVGDIFDLGIVGMDLAARVATEAGHDSRRRFNLKTETMGCSGKGQVHLVMAGQAVLIIDLILLRHSARR